jgi:hypothetical protein
MKQKALCHFLLSTLLLLCFSLNAQEKSPNSTTITKGRYYTTITFSLDQRTAENENQLLRFVLDQNRLQYRVISNSGYAVKDNLTLGLGIGYGRKREEITFENQDGDEVTSKSLEQGFSVAPTMRNYVPIGNGALQILVQTELNLTIGESLERQFLSNSIDKWEGNFIEASLGVSPGAVLFFDNHWAFETTVGIAGLSTRIDEQTKNNDEDNRSRVVNTNIDLRLNLLQLNLGVAYYF